MLLLPAEDRVLSSDAIVRVGGVVLRRGQLSLQLPKSLGRSHFGDFAVPSSPGRVGGLLRVGTLSVDLLFHRSELTVHLRLPDGFADAQGAPVDGAVKASADDRYGFKLKDAVLNAPDALLGGLRIPNLAVLYDSSTGDWEGTGKIAPFFKSFALDVKIGFHGGRFGHLDVDFELPDPGWPLGYGLFLTKVGAGLQLDPETVLSGHVTFSAGGKYLGCNAVDVDGAFALKTDPAPVTFKVKGTLKLACFLQVGDATFEARADGYVQFGGHLQLPLIPELLWVKANVDGRFEDPHFQFDASGDVCLADLACVGGEIVASDTGAGACADFGTWHPGAGVKFHPFEVIVMGHSCNIAQFRSLPRAAQVSGAQTVTVDRGRAARIALQRRRRGAADDAGGAGRDAADGAVLRTRVRGVPRRGPRADVLPARSPDGGDVARGARG